MPEVSSKKKVWKLRNIWFSAFEILCFVYKLVGDLLSLSRMFLGEGQTGKNMVRTAAAAEKKEMMMNMPRKPTMGDRTCVRIAMIGAAAAEPVITKP